MNKVSVTSLTIFSRRRADRVDFLIKKKLDDQWNVEWMKQKNQREKKRTTLQFLLFEEEADDGRRGSSGRFSDEWRVGPRVRDGVVRGLQNRRHLIGPFSLVPSRCLVLLSSNEQRPSGCKEAAQENQSVASISRKSWAAAIFFVNGFVCCAPFYTAAIKERGGSPAQQTNEPKRNWGSMLVKCRITWLLISAPKKGADADAGVLVASFNWICVWFIGWFTRNLAQSESHAVHKPRHLIASFLNENQVGSELTFCRRKQLPHWWPKLEFGRQLTAPAGGLNNCPPPPLVLHHSPEPETQWAERSTHRQTKKIVRPKPVGRLFFFGEQNFFFFVQLVTL